MVSFFTAHVKGAGAVQPVRQVDSQKGECGLFGSTLCYITNSLPNPSHYVIRHGPKLLVGYLLVFGCTVVSAVTKTRGLTPDSSSGARKGGNDVASHSAYPNSTDVNDWDMRFGSGSFEGFANKKKEIERNIQDFERIIEGFDKKFEGSESFEYFTGEEFEDLQQCPVDSNRTVKTNRVSLNDPEDIYFDAKDTVDWDIAESGQCQPSNCASLLAEDNYPEKTVNFLIEYFRMVKPDDSITSANQGIINRVTQSLSNVYEALFTGKQWLDRITDRADINALKARIREVGVNSLIYWPPLGLYRSVIDNAIYGTTGGTALHHAAQYRAHSSAIVFLLKAGADPDRLDDDGSSALHRAVKYGHFDNACLLVEAGASLDYMDAFYETPLHIAAEQGYTEIVKLLVKHKAMVNLYEKKGSCRESALHIAAENGNDEMASCLIEAGAGVNIQACNGKGRTPLHYATQAGHFDVMSTLIANKANVNDQDDDGWSALHLAANNGDIKSVQLLRKAGAKLDMRNNDGESPLQVALRNGHDGITKHLG